MEVGTICRYRRIRSEVRSGKVSPTYTDGLPYALTCGMNKESSGERQRWEHAIRLAFASLPESLRRKVSCINLEPTRKYTGNDAADVGIVFRERDFPVHDQIRQVKCEIGNVLEERKLSEERSPFFLVRADNEEPFPFPKVSLTDRGDSEMDGSRYGFIVGWDGQRGVWVARVREFPHLSAESAEGPEQAVTFARREVSLELLRWEMMKEEPPLPLAEPMIERDRGKLPEHPRSFMWWDAASFNIPPDSPDVVLFRSGASGFGKPGQRNLPSEQGRTPGDVYSVITHFGLRLESSRSEWLRALLRETVAELFVFGRREAELSAAALVPGERAVSGFLALAAPLTLPPLTPLMVQVFSEPLVSLDGFDPETDYLEVRAFLYGRLRDVPTIRNK